MNHQFEKSDYGVRCTLCEWEWKKETHTNCPGCKRYNWGAQPRHLLRDKELFGNGLQKGEAKPVGCIVTGRGDELYLYDPADCSPADVVIDFGKSKYHFIEQEKGFDLWRIDGTKISVRCEDGFFLSFTLNGQAAGQRHLYSFDLMIDHVVSQIVFKMSFERSSDEQEAIDMIRSALYRRLRDQWQRIVDKFADPVKVKFAKLYWASNQCSSGLFEIAAFYNDPTLEAVRNDFTKYHAFRLWICSQEHEIENRRHDLTVLRQYLEGWREALMPTVVRSKKALNKTLDKFPVGMPASLMPRLTLMHLEQPITNRLHLLFALTGANHHNWGLHEATVLRATPEQVAAACAAVGARVNARSRTRQIGEAAGLILDYPEPYNGDLFGLARRSGEWHAAQPRRRSEPTHSLLPGQELPLAKLDYAKLAEQGVRPLRTVHDVRDEGYMMRHCVSSYASKAAAGLCYLFHIDHEGQQATIEVLPDGQITQAYGPENSKNEACSHGMKVLLEAFPAVQL